MRELHSPLHVSFLSNFHLFDTESQPWKLREWLDYVTRATRSEVCRHVMFQWALNLVMFYDSLVWMTEASETEFKWNRWRNDTTRSNFTTKKLFNHICSRSLFRFPSFKLNRMFIDLLYCVYYLNTCISAWLVFCLLYHAISNTLQRKLLNKTSTCKCSRRFCTRKESHTSHNIVSFQILPHTLKKIIRNRAVSAGD